MLFSDQIVKRIQATSIEREKQGELSPDILKLIYQKRLFKLFVPTTLDGVMSPFIEAIHIFEEAAQIDGSLGWMIAIGSGGGFFVPFMEPEVSRQVYQKETALIAGSGAPSGTAYPQDGGYLVTGEWKYCSGATYATTFTANCKVMQGKKEEVLAVILQPEQVRVKRDWNAIGLKATGSHSILVDQVFVPAALTFQLTQPKAFLDEFIYQYPFQTFAEVSFAAVVLGIGQRFLDKVKQFLNQKQEVWNIMNQQKYSVILTKINEHVSRFDQCRAEFYSIVSGSWDQFVQEGHLTRSEQHQVTTCCKKLTKWMLSIGMELLPLFGLSAVMEDTLLNQAWRDLLTASQHTLLQPI
ncbi:Acyl-CoA dehydrogenase [Seinonella peptonophila]|uniref:Acyl-CoA dehydrogenase n=1 Tax=Seinonella peptonophila TaxID=112248 RepID=A0A1M4SNP3_9BACL|nr:hypothetical protein [Seinonella peptonophila]SHE33904.1 Acyl-CoA dehydrogenase [Seinonella peptonophila]